MTRLSRFLRSTGSIYLTGVLVLIGHTILTMQAVHGENFALYVLIVLLFVWTGLALANSIGRRRSLEGWERALGSWDETQKLAVDYVSLIVEACDALSTWDRETADEIIARTRTISALRQQNFDERNGK